MLRILVACLNVDAAQRPSVEELLCDPAFGLASLNACLHIADVPLAAVPQAVPPPTADGPTPTGVRRAMIKRGAHTIYLCGHVWAMI